MTRWQWISAALATALVGVLVVGAVAWPGSDSDAATDPAPADAVAGSAEAEALALAAAREYTVAATTYDYRRLSESFAWLDQYATENFAETYRRAVSLTRQLITRLESSAEGKVLAAAANTVDDTHVDVLLFVDQTIRGATTSQPRVERSRIFMQLVDDGGTWLIDNIDLCLKGSCPGAETG